MTQAEKAEFQPVRAIFGHCSQSQGANYVFCDCRKAWAVEITATTTDSLQTYAVQTLRNSITAASFLATACSLIAVTGVGNTILDANKVARLDKLAVSIQTPSPPSHSLPPKLPESVYQTSNLLRILNQRARLVIKPQSREVTLLSCPG